MTARLLLSRLRHPVRSAGRLVRRLATGPGLPFGRTAETRRLLRSGVDGDQRVLVVGPAAAVRQALPGAALDVVGVDPHDRTITVVSDALDEGSLPRRWRCVVVTDPAPATDRLLAAAQAVVPGGLLAVVLPRAGAPIDLPGLQTQRRLDGRRLQLVLGRVSA